MLASRLGASCALLLLLSATAPRLAAQTWSRVPFPFPSSRRAPEMVYDSARQRIVLFGGYRSPTASNGFGDTWEWNGLRWGLITSIGPSPRTYFGMAYDRWRDRIVVYGGLGRNASGIPATLEDTWEFDGVSWSQVNVTGPARPVGACMLFDDRRGVCVLFFDQQTWEYDGLAWTRRNLSGPPVTGGHSMVFDSHRGVCVLFARSATYGRHQLWEYDGASWTFRTDQGPPGLDQEHLGYDSRRRRVVLQGGVIASANLHQDTWEWDGFQWLRTVEGTTFWRVEAGIAYDELRGQMLVACGCSTEFQCEIRESSWRYGPTTTSRVHDLGGGCSAGAAPAVLGAGELPLIGNARFALELSGLPPSTPVLLGISAFAQPGQVFGACIVAPVLPFHIDVALVGSSTGDVRLALPLPYDPSLIAATTFSQALAIENGGPFFGFAGLSNALEVRVGD